VLPALHSLFLEELPVRFFERFIDMRRRSGRAIAVFNTWS